MFIFRMGSLCKLLISIRWILLIVVVSFLCLGGVLIILCGMSCLDLVEWLEVLILLIFFLFVCVFVVRVDLFFLLVDCCFNFGGVLSCFVFWLEVLVVLLLVGVLLDSLDVFVIVCIISKIFWSEILRIRGLILIWILVVCGCELFMDIWMEKLLMILSCELLKWFIWYRNMLYWEIWKVKVCCCDRRICFVFSMRVFEFVFNGLVMRMIWVLIMLMW